MRRLWWLNVAGLLCTACTAISDPGGGAGKAGGGGFAGSGGSRAPGGSGGSVAPGGSGGSPGGSGGSGIAGSGGTIATRLGSAEVGPDGGVVNAADGSVSVHVPPLALRSPLTLTIDTVATPTSGGLGRGFHLGPDGAVFDRPVEVIVTPLGGIVPELQRLATVEGGSWVVLSAHRYDPFAGRVHGETAHFSEFDLLLVNPCRADADCAEGNVCNPGSGECEEIVTCDPERLYSCPGGQTCGEEAICRFECQSQEICQGTSDDNCDGTIDEGCPTCADVPTGAICDGVCVDTSYDIQHCGRCDNNCGNAAVCLDSRCWPLPGDACNSDEDCAEGLFCSRGTCEPEPIPCNSQDDCPSFLSCIEGWCY